MTILPKPSAKEITGIDKTHALDLLFSSYLHQRIEGEGPQSFQAWLEMKAPEFQIKAMVGRILIENSVDSMRRIIKQCQQKMDEKQYNSQTLPGIARTQEQANAVLAELLRIRGIMQHLKIE